LSARTSAVTTSFSGNRDGESRNFSAQTGGGAALWYTTKAVRETLTVLISLLTHISAAVDSRSDVDAEQRFRLCWRAAVTVEQNANVHSLYT